MYNLFLDSVCSLSLNDLTNEVYACILGDVLLAVYSGKKIGFEKQWSADAAGRVWFLSFA